MGLDLNKLLGGFRPSQSAPAKPSTQPTPQEAKRLEGERVVTTRPSDGDRGDHFVIEGDLKAAHEAWMRKMGMS